MGTGSGKPNSRLKGSTPTFRAITKGKYDRNTKVALPEAYIRKKLKRQNKIEDGLSVAYACADPPTSSELHAITRIPKGIIHGTDRLIAEDIEAYGNKIGQNLYIDPSSSRHANVMGFPSPGLNHEHYDDAEDFAKKFIDEFKPYGPRY